MNMNLKQILFFLFCSVFITSLPAVAQDLNGLTAKLKEAVTAVKTGSKNYEAKLESLEPGVLKYSYDEVDSKGNRTAYAYEFNLADIDPYAVRENTQKDLISSVLAVRNKQKLVKVYKNNEVQSYDDQVTIYANSIEGARVISDLVKKAIPPAEKVAAGRLKVSGYDAMISWLSANVKNVSLGTKSINQKITKGDKPGVLVFTQTETDSKGATEEVFTFNLADLNVNSINFKVTGNKFAINMETLQKAKYIGTRKKGQVGSYVNDLSINTNNVDEGRDLKTVFSLLVPQAIEKVKADMPAATTDKDALAKIKTLTTDVTIGTKLYTQTLDAQCYCTFTQVEKDTKATEANVFKFNWMDFNPNGSTIDVSGEKIFIDLQMNNKDKLIVHTKNDKPDGYESAIRLYLPDVESARRMKFLVDKAIDKCKATYKDPFPADTKSMVVWLMKNVKDITLAEVTIKQKLELAEEGNHNKMKYTRVELNAKGSGAEEVYEFNLADMNPLSIQADVKGKWLYVTMESDFKNKIIKYYKDGKIQPYTAKIDFAVNDTELSRAIINALKKSTKGLKPDK
jgi:hypothetical protein